MKVADFFSKKEHLFSSNGKYASYSRLFYYFRSLCLDETVKATEPVPVRDALSVSRYLFLWVIALLPCLLFGIFNTGAQFFAFKGISAGFLLDFGMGLLIVLPLFLIVLCTGFFWGQFFSKLHNRPIYPGLFLGALVYTLMLPPSISWWKAVVGFTFGIVLGQELFGGYGKTFLNPALLGKLFLSVSFPRSVAGDAWTAVSARNLSVLEGKYGVSALSVATHLPKGEYVVDVLTRMGQGFWALILGVVPGGIGDTSVLCVLLGAWFLWYCRLVHYRIWLGVGVGVFIASYSIGIFSGFLNPISAVPWIWHFFMGGFSFLVVFIAGDPASSPSTNEAKLLYGFCIGLFTVIIRNFNVSVVDGGMLAVLIVMLFRPVIDKWGLYFRFKKRVLNELK